MRARIGPLEVGIVTSWVVTFMPASGLRMAGSGCPFHCIRTAMDCRYVRATGQSATEIAATVISNARTRSKIRRFRRCDCSAGTGGNNVQVYPLGVILTQAWEGRGDL